MVVSALAAGPLAAQGMSGHDHGAGGMQHGPASQPAAAAPMSDGEVRKVDARAGTVTLKHGRLENLNMAPMTMVFKVRDPAWLPTLKPGDKVQFSAERVGGNLTVVTLNVVK